MFSDLVHKVSQSFVSWHNFLDFIIKENSFSFFDWFFELVPVWSWSRDLIWRKVPVTLLIPPHFRMFGNIDIFQILDPKFFSIIDVNSCVIFSNVSQSGMLTKLIFPTLIFSLLTKFSSSMLFLTIVCLLS